MRFRVALTASLLMLTAGCAAADDAVSVVVPAEEAVQAIGASGGVRSEVCVINRNVLLVAAEAFEALTGSLPAVQQDLIDQQLIRGPVEGYELAVGSDGRVEPIATPGGPCA